MCFSLVFIHTSKAAFVATKPSLPPQELGHPEKAYESGSSESGFLRLPSTGLLQRQAALL